MRAEHGEVSAFGCQVEQPFTTHCEQSKLAERAPAMRCSADSEPPQHWGRPRPIPVSGQYPGNDEPRRSGAGAGDESVTACGGGRYIPTSPPPPAQDATVGGGPRAEEGKSE